MLCALIFTKLAYVGLDQPNHRSLHTKPVPRTGGLAIMLGVMLGWYQVSGITPWLVAIVLLITVSLMDDFLDIPVRWRFIVQCAVVALFLYWICPSLSIAMLVFLLVSLVWMTNLYNFMDGSNGLAGGMAAIGFMAYSLAAYQSNDFMLCALSGIIVVCSLAFLLFNFHPARIFMGDTGSIPLGFSVGALGVLGWLHEDWSMWFPILVFSPFIVDATVTLLKRAMRKEKIWQAHRSHYYQRVIQMGWSHRKTALYEYLLMTTTGLLALYLQNANWIAVTVGLCVALIIMSVLMLEIDAKWDRYQQSQR